MMTRLSDRALERLDFFSMLGSFGFCLPFGYFGEWAIPASWLVCMYLWLNASHEMGNRSLHPNGNV